MQIDNGEIKLNLYHLQTHVGQGLLKLSQPNFHKELNDPLLGTLHSRNV